MQRLFQIRLAVIVLALSTLFAGIFASLNFVQEGKFQKPTDGVWWVEAHGGLRAERVLADGPGMRAGIKSDDLLITANDRPTPRIAPLVREMYRTGVYGKANYTLIRGGVRVEVPVILEAPDRSVNQGFRIIATVYLLIGLYVLFRRWTAPRSTHFYVFCLLSFVLYAFNYTGKFNSFDWTIYWGKIVAGALQPALFLHFALAFPEERPWTKGRPWLIALTYLPAAIVIGLQVAAIELWSATERLSHRLDQIATGYLAIYYVLAALAVLHQLSPDGYPASPPATEVADTWNRACGGSLHAAARHSVPAGYPGPCASDKGRSYLPGLSAAHIQLGHRSLSPDGCGLDLQARRDLHAGYGWNCRPVFRRGRGGGGGGTYAPAAVEHSGD